VFLLLLRQLLTLLVEYNRNFAGGIILPGVLEITAYLGGVIINSVSFYPGRLFRGLGYSGTAAGPIESRAAMSRK